MQWVIYIRILDWTVTDGAVECILVDECHSCNESVDASSSNSQGSILLSLFDFGEKLQFACD